MGRFLSTTHHPTTHYPTTSFPRPMPAPIAKLEVLSYYAKKFQRLRVDRAHGVAPHKPILMLAVIELFERGAMAENRIELTPQLNRTFLKYWSYLGSTDHNPEISRPYFHMKSGKFWHLLTLALRNFWRQTLS